MWQQGSKRGCDQISVVDLSGAERCTAVSTLHLHSYYKIKTKKPPISTDVHTILTYVKCDSRFNVESSFIAFIPLQ